MTDEKPDHIKYAYGFILWFVLPLIGVIPALFVNEDLRRLNMKDVEKSVYFEEKVLLNHTREVRRTIMGGYKMMASPAMLYQLDLSDLYHALEKESRSSVQPYERPSSEGLIDKEGLETSRSRSLFDFKPPKSKHSKAHF
jgi:hypothetical protein